MTAPSVTASPLDLTDIRARLTAAAKALKKHDDKLDGVRLHRILDKVAKTTSTPVVEAVG